MADLKLNKLRFNSAACFALVQQIIDTHLDELSEFLVNIVRWQIWANGNGSYKYMRLLATALVEETKREITNDHITLEVGIKMEGLNERAFVLVSVVLHGNQAGGPLHEKPGIATWTKYVTMKRMPDPDNRNANNMLPDGFNQDDKMDDILDKVEQNVLRDSNKRVDAFIAAVAHDINSMNWSAFLTGG